MGKIVLKNDYQEVTSTPQSRGVGKGSYDAMHIESNDSVVVIVAVVGRLLLIDHKRQNEVSKEFIRGYVEKREKVEAAAVREMIEEFNIPEDRIHDVEVLNTYDLDNSYIDQKVNVVLIQLHSLENSDKLNTAEGILGYEWVDHTDIEEYIKDGTIKDGYTIAAYGILTL